MPTPNKGMKEEAQRGLDWRKDYGRGGTAVGVARARDIVNGKDLSDKTVARMFSFFSRHEVDKKAEGFNKGEKGYPSNGRIAWALWGGDAGFAWAKSHRQERSMKVGDKVNWNSSGGEAEGKIISIHKEGKVNVPNTDVSLNATDDEPVALIKLYKDGEETDQVVGHKLSTLRDYDEEERKQEIEEEMSERKGVEVIHRSMEFSGKINEETRTCQVCVSSEEPVERSFGKEILRHDKESINLDFMNSGRAPLLLDHDQTKQIGVIESVELGEDRRLRANVRFGRSALAQEAMQDVADGIKANISVGYSIEEMKRSDKETYVATKWNPMEASLVSIPADVTAYVGRSGEVSNEPKIEPKIEESIMTTENTVDIASIEANAKKDAQRNASQIVELGQRHNMADEARQAIAEGKSIDEFRGVVLDQIGSNKALESQDVGMDKKEIKRFSLVKAIRALANPNDFRAQQDAEFEFECSRKASEIYGRTAQGIMIPAEVLRSWSQRDLNTTNDGDLFSDDYRAGDFIDVLRNASSVMGAGATILSGLSGDVAIPKKTGASSASWITEGGNAPESEFTVGSVRLTPKTLGAFTDVTRQLLMQSSLDVENLIRDDLAQALALAIDKAGLEGTGASGQPTGILNTTGVNQVTDFAGVNPTFAEVVSLETAVAEDNALAGNLAYILPASMYGALKTTEKATGTAQFVANGQDINGYRAIVSNQATAGNMYFGNFSDLLIGMFGGLDITVDPYTHSTSGTVRVVALQSVDMAVRHAQSFAFGNDG